MAKSQAKQILTAKPTLLLLFVGLVVFGVIQYRQLAQRRSVNIEINHLQQQQQSLEQKNQELSQSLQYLTSSDYKDRIARQQLGLKKNGEIVYNFTVDNSVQDQSSQAVPGTGSGSNLEAWWRYLFHNKND